VDRNPLALELARTALWLEAFTPDAPLSFLDHHLACGDALLGVLDLAVLKEGIPQDAYKPLTGDETEVCKALKFLTKQRDNRQIPLDLDATPMAESLSAMDKAPDDSLEAIADKCRKLVEAAAAGSGSPLAVGCDLFLAAFLAPKMAETKDLVPTTQDLLLTLTGGEPRPGVKDFARSVVTQNHGLHWPLAFAQVFQRGGFAVILGNPPWERIKLQEQEFFAERAPEISAAPNQAARRQRIAALATNDNAADRALFDDLHRAKHEAEAASLFAHDSGRYSHTGTGDVNLYALFAETALQATANDGRAGLVLPTGVATDDGTSAFFGHVVASRRLASLYDFENREAIFPGVHRSYKFCLFTLGMAEAVQFLFFATRVEHLNDPRRRFTLTPEEIALLNPNTRTCPVFRSQRDAELTKKIYRNVPVLIREWLKGE
jgi:hypothetical protein